MAQDSGMDAVPHGRSVEKQTHSTVTEHSTKQRTSRANVVAALRLVLQFSFLQELEMCKGPGLEPAAPSGISNLQLQNQTTCPLAKPHSPLPLPRTTPTGS
jgi:hypothetical protein